MFLIFKRSALDILLIARYSSVAFHKWVDNNAIQSLYYYLNYDDLDGYHHRGSCVGEGPEPLTAAA